MFYFFIFISLLTGHFRNLFYFTLIIFIHELGHSITGLLFKFNLKRIEIYPYGGCSKLEYDVNISVIKEFLVLIMGPIFQILLVLIIYIFKINVPDYFYTYNYFILIFNLLPIYPLDGGRLLYLLLCILMSYYNSLKWCLYISYFIFIMITFFILFQNNLLMVLIFILLGIQIFKEIKQIDYYYDKFLLERYINDLFFNRIKRVSNIKQMKRSCYHFFIFQNKVIEEKEMLNNYFNISNN